MQLDQIDIKNAIPLGNDDVDNPAKDKATAESKTLFSALWFVSIITQDSINPISFLAP